MKPWQAENLLATDDVEKYITNPLNAFLLIKRSTSEIENIFAKLENTIEKLKTSLNQLMPDKNIDLAGAVEGLMRLQYAYKLKSSDLAQGVVDGKKTRRNLTPHDLYVLGVEIKKVGDKNKYFDYFAYFAKEYLSMALKKSEKIADNDIDFSELEENLNYLKAINRKNPHNDEIIRSGKYSAIKENLFSAKVCRGEISRNASETKHLRCRFVSNSFFSKIAPFKVEEINADPYIVIFIDVLSDREIEILKNLAIPNMQKALVGEIPFELFVRVAQHVWLGDEIHEVVARVTRRVEVRSI